MQENCVKVEQCIIFKQRQFLQASNFAGGRHVTFKHHPVAILTEGNRRGSQTFLQKNNGRKKNNVTNVVSFLYKVRLKLQYLLFNILQKQKEAYISQTAQSCQAVILPPEKDNTGNNVTQLENAGS